MGVSNKAWRILDHVVGLEMCLMDIQQSPIYWDSQRDKKKTCGFTEHALFRDYCHLLVAPEAPIGESTD